MSGCRERKGWGPLPCLPFFPVSLGSQPGSEGIGLPYNHCFCHKRPVNPHWVWSPDTGRLASPSYPLASCPGRPDCGLAGLAGPNPLLWGWGEGVLGRGGREGGEAFKAPSIAVGYFEQRLLEAGSRRWGSRVAGIESGQRGRLGLGPTT